MELQLTRPLCFFDLETTGTNIATDRIIEISILKLYPDGRQERKTWLVNPTIPIPKESEAVHGISNEKVSQSPTFKEIAKEVHAMIKDSDLAGYNSDRFDIPLLAEEMLRCGLDFDLGNRVTVDVQTIFHKMEQRTLSAAYKFYCKKNLDDAHSAAADTEATYEVLKSQLERYPELGSNVKSLSEFTSRKKMADFAGFIIFNSDGKEVFSFGKYKGREVATVLEQDPGYYGWLMNADFPLYTKKILTGIKLRRLTQR